MSLNCTMYEKINEEKNIVKKEKYHSQLASRKGGQKIDQMTFNISLRQKWQCAFFFSWNDIEEGYEFVCCNKSNNEERTTQKE